MSVSLIVQAIIRIEGLNMKKRRIFEIIQVGNLSDIPSRAYDAFLIVAVLVNIFIALFDTFPESEPYQGLIWGVELFTVIFFTVDYVLRIWTADFLYPGMKEGKARIRFIFSWAGLIDVLSCVPFLVSAGGGVLRMFRIIRILRVFRIHHYADPLRVIGDVLKKKRGQLLSSIFIVFILMIAASLLMYNLEHEAQPEAFANAFSGFWWAANTLLTVGYGDIIPVTLAGKICGTVLTFLGVGMVAIPTGILSAGFMEQVTIVRERAVVEGFIEDVRMVQEERHKDYTYCPYCGKELPK